MTVGGLKSLQLKNGDRAWGFVRKNSSSNGVIALLELFYFLEV